MRSQTTGILLCALLISTFAHEYLHHQHPQAQKRVAKHNSKHLSHLSQKRDGSTDSGEVCGWQCPPDGSNTTSTGVMIKIIINATTNIFAMRNTTENYGLAFDFNTKLIGLFDGNTGNVIIIDVNANTGVHAVNQTSSLVWLASKVSYETYINSLTSLKVVYDFALKAGTKFNVSSPSQEILELVAVKCLESVGAVIGRDVKKDYSNALVVLIDLAKRLNTVLKGTLSGLFKDITATTFTINVGLGITVERFEGLAYDLNEIQGGLGTLIKHHIKINLQKILAANSGIESLTYLLNSQVNGGLDVVTAIGGNSSIAQVFDIIVHLCGASSEGYSAFVRIAGLIIGAAKGNVSAEVLIEALVKYSITAKDDEKFYDQFNTSLKALLKAIIKTNTDGRVDATVNDFKKLINGTLVIGGVNIADVIKILAKNGNNVAIDLVIGVLVALGSAVNVDKSIATLILYILTELNTSAGITIIINLFPSINFNGSISNSGDNAGDGNLLESILKGVNINDIIKAGFDVVKILEQLPVIGDIWSTISGSLNTQSNGSIKLSDVINSSSASGIVKSILSLLGSALHIDLTSNGNNIGIGIEYSSGSKRNGHHHVEGKHFHKHENRHIGHFKHGIQEKIHHRQQ